MKTYAGFAEGQVDYALGPSFICILQDPLSDSELDTRRTARQVFGVDPDSLRYVKGHIAARQYDQRGTVLASYHYSARGYMVFSPRDHPGLQSWLRQCDYQREASRRAVGSRR